MNFIVCADLHLKESEKQYSFSVLEEIIDLCANKKCEALLFAGDIFDDWNEVKLRTDFRTAIERLPDNCNVYFLPGNHEELRASSSGKLDTFDFGSKVQLLHKKPFSFFEDFCEDAELLAIPFQKEYSGYRNWEVPQKKKSKRILLAHGIVTGAGIYTGPCDVKDGVFDEDLFSHFNIDLVAIGHIHSCKVIKKGNTAIVYPGSPRVCRKGESGLRYVILCNLNTGKIDRINIAAAGEYKEVSVFALPGGELQSNISELKILPNDYIHLDVSGVVEDETSVAKNIIKFKSELEKKCRKVTESRENLSVVSCILTHPLAKSFLDLWESKMHDYSKEETGVYENARLQGLLAIKNIMEKKR